MVHFQFPIGDRLPRQVYFASVPAAKLWGNSNIGNVRIR